MKPINEQLKIKDDDYPALYISADTASLTAQNCLLNGYKLNLTLLILGAITAAFSKASVLLSVLSGIVFLALLGIYIFMRSQKYQDKWYRTRALAESIKTATWRFMMKADPFDGEDVKNIKKFNNLLEELLNEHKDLGGILASASDQDEITKFMKSVRCESYTTKHQFYLKSRIDEQRSWYVKKSKANRILSKRFFISVCLLYACAIAWLFVRVANPTYPYLPVEILAIGASSIIGWVQLKRYDELVSSYGLTSHEIGIIKSKFSEISNEEELSNFVSDAENAFSREHTQWAARRDH